MPKLEDYINSYLVEYGLSIISPYEQRLNIAYEEVIVDSIVSGTEFTAKVMYRAKGNTKTNSSASVPYYLAFTESPSAGGTVSKVVYNDGVKTTKTETLSASPYGITAKSALQALIPVGTNLSVLTLGQDKYDSWIALVFNSTDNCINIQQVANGAAILMPPHHEADLVPNNTDTDFASKITTLIKSELRSAMQTAESNKLGIWSDTYRTQLDNWISSALSFL